MAISFYDLSVATYVQTLTAVTGFLDRGLAHCRDNDIDPQEIVETRLFHDMLPFSFQVLSVAHHSIGAVRGIEAGVFAPPGAPAGPLDYPGLQAIAAEALAALQALDVQAVNALAGKDVTFEARGFKMPFTAEEFVLSFSLPNVHFHATTAYDILRSKGAPLGKRDYMGPVRMKR